MWKIYKDKTSESIAEFDTIIKVATKYGTQITTYPTEVGAFTSINKVNQPVDISVTVAKGGSVADITEIIDRLKKYLNSTELVAVTTPFDTYLSMNLVQFSYSHSQTDGANMLVADLSFQEVRQVNPQYTNISPSNPNYQSNKDLGKRLPNTPQGGK